MAEQAVPPTAPGGSGVPQTIPLRDGSRMPAVGLGTWKLNKDIAEAVVRRAIELGYRCIDCASDYWNEKEVGEGIASAIAAGIVKREDLWVTTKLFNTFHGPHVADAFARQLADLQLSYVDLYLIHFPTPLQYVDPSVRYPAGWSDPGAKPVHVDIPLATTWAEMEKLKDRRVARHIGVSNFTTALVADIHRACRHRIEVNQVELHPYLAQPMLRLAMAAAGVAITAFSSLGNRSYTELAIAYKDPRVPRLPSLLEHPAVAAVAARVRRSPAQVLLRWAVQQGIAVIPKSTNADRLAENLAVAGVRVGAFEPFDLSKDDIASLNELTCGLRYNNPADFIDYPIYD